LDKIAFPYRSSTHLPFLHVIAEGGFYEKYGLEVDYDRPIGSSEAHRAVAAGEIEFVGGNHVSTYGRRARGDNWVYLGQSVNSVPGRTLCVRADSGINRIEDLRGKVVGSRGSHPKLNDWLQLKQHGLDVDRDEVAIVDQVAHDNGMDPTDSKAMDETEPLWEWVRDKAVDAAFIVPPTTENARDAGLKLIDIETLPMIYFTTFSTGMAFLERHPDIVERFLKAVIEGVHFFKTEPQRAIEIMRRRYTIEGPMDLKAATALYGHLAPALEPKLYPTMQAIANVYEEGKYHDADANRINPMQLWDLHAIRRIDDSGFVDDLYKKVHA
jgi:NitT/TauT family transport system substrate-binding protein